MTMNTPGFTAEDSLHATRGHYRTSTRARNLSAHAMGTIRPSEIDVPGEVIEIEDDAPWSPPSWGGHTGPGTTSPPPETGGGEPGGGGGVPSKTDPDPDKPGQYLHGCSANQIQSDAAKECQQQVESDLTHSPPLPIKDRHYMRCTGKRRGNVVHPKMECCQGFGKQARCKELN
jgi:hypothetical protein